MGSIPIIGTGAVSAAGYGISDGYKKIVVGANGLRPLTLFDSKLKKVPLCGTVGRDPFLDLPSLAPNRSTALAMHAVNEALAPIQDRKSLKLGIVLATTVAGITKSEEFYRLYRQDPSIVKKAWKYLSYHEPTAVAGYIARAVNANGFHSLSTACSTSLHAAGMAKRLVENGSYDLCLAIGVDALSMLTVRGFASLMLIDFSGCKPFDAERVGISLGEGAGVLLMASNAVANSLCLSPKGYFAGWGASADCYHMTAPHPDGEGATRAARAAISEARLPSEAVSMIVTHGTATPDNDIGEIKSMQTVFETLPPFFSMKRSLGHTLAASGTLEIAYALESLHCNRIPVSGGFSKLDEKIGVTPSAGEDKALSSFIKNAFGFGGNNASVIITKEHIL